MLYRNRRSTITPPIVAIVIAVTALASLVWGAPAAADPSAPKLRFVEHLGANLWSATAYSESMKSEIPLQVIRPAGTNSDAPTLYLLNGAGGGEDGANWIDQTDAAAFFAAKNINVVIPTKGIGSYYTNWIATDPKIGRPQWQTFLTRELPEIVDASLNTNGRNAIAGLSMSATSVLSLAESAPQVYRSVASYSGCARTSNAEGQAAVRSIVHIASGADASNMWGPPSSPHWRANDPYVNAAKLRGLSIYISAGSGLPGAYDTPDQQAPGAPPIANQIVVGGALEAAARRCTQDMVARLRQLNIPAVVNLPTTGTHSWRYWQDALHHSWPTIAAGLRS